MTSTTFGSVPAPAGTDEPVHRARVEWASVPKVDLLPPEIREGRRFRRVQRGLAAGLVLTVLAGIGATVWAQQQVDQAKDDLAQVQADGERLRGQQAQFAEVPKVLAQLDSARAARSAAMARDILWYRYLDDLAVAVPATAKLGTMTVALTDSVVPAGNPLEAAGMGTVTFSGRSSSFPDVAKWLTAVNTLHGMDVSQLSNATRASSAEKVSFGARVIITPAALSHRYDPKAG